MLKFSKPKPRSPYDCFASFFDLWLAKHGLLHLQLEGLAEATDFVLVPSGQVASHAFRHAASGYFDGPVDVDVLNDLGIRNEQRTASALFVWSADQTFSGGSYFSEAAKTYPVGYRAIKTAPRRARAEQFVTPGASRGLGPVRFDYQVFEPSGSWMPLLWASESSNVQSGGAPVVLSDGRRIVSGLPIMALLGSQHATFDLPEAYLRTETEGFSGAFEVWFRKLLLDACQAAGAWVATFDPWPAGKKASLTIRHDYDRAVPRRHLSQILDVYDHLGLKASIGFLKRISPRDQMRLLLDRGHEAALHSEALDFESFEGEVRHHEDVTGQPVAGVTFHGGAGAFGIRGSVNVKWAEEAGLAYCETYLRTGSMHRVGYIDNGNSRRFRPLGLPFHVTFDSAFMGGDLDTAAMKQLISSMFEGGLHVTLMNHPDLYTSHLLAFLKQLELANIWCATHKEIIAWKASLGGLSVRQDSTMISFSVDKPLLHDLRLHIGNGRVVHTINLTSGSTEVGLNIACLQ